MKGDFNRAPKWAMHLAKCGNFQLRYWIKDPAIGARMMSADSDRFQCTMNDVLYESCLILSTRAGITEEQSRFMAGNRSED